MKILFIDTETNGLPKMWNAKLRDLNNWPRCIQLAWTLTDDTGIVLEQRVDLIKPDGWEIPAEPFWINNGFSQETSEAEGITMPEALTTMVEAMNQADVVVAHNMNFDYNVVGAEMIRYGFRANSKKVKACTMSISTDLMKLPGRYGYKYPKLEELHHWLFNEDFDGAHDAMVDVKACMRCFFELKARGHITIDDGVKV